jgi:hypothetical protein
MRDRGAGIVRANLQHRLPEADQQRNGHVRYEALLAGQLAGRQGVN